MKEITTAQLIAIIKYHLAIDEISVEIDPAKCFEFIVEEENNTFIVKYKWWGGMIQDAEKDPQIQRDTTYTYCDNRFTILKSESLSKLSNYLTDMVNEVNEFDFKIENY